MKTTEHTSKEEGEVDMKAPKYLFALITMAMILATMSWSEDKDRSDIDKRRPGHRSGDDRDQ